ncbi:MAG: ABC transporter ATP-binding protein [Bacteroidaceae bacterium]|nr:ABC transporter ATP-binding protein [Bacteroidaceae bacterium]
MKEKVNMRNAFALHMRGLKELHTVSPKFFPLLTVYSIFSAITPYITVFFSAQILKELATLRREDNLWQWVIAGILCVGIAAIAKAMLYRRYNSLLNDIYGRKEILFIHKMFSLDFSELDKQENHDLRAQIQQNENWSSWGLMRVEEAYIGAVSSVIGLLSGIALTVSLFTSPVPESAGWLTVLNNPVFIIVLAAMMVVISILAGNLSAKSMRCWSDFAEEATFGNRLFGHFGFIGTDKTRSVDIRMNNQQGLISAYWTTNSSFGVNGPFGKAARGRMGVYASLGVCITTLITGFIYVFTCLKAWGGAFDVGSITQYVGAATAMVTNVFALTDLLGIMKTNAPYLEKTFEFLDIPNAMYQGSLTTEKRADRQYEVEFKDVSFKYPGSDIWALRHVNMKFKVGKRLAIVGENGSGKTTFIKLLCRLYDPQEGQILLNGIDIRKYKYDDYMNIFSIVFQDFQLICQPLGNNVAGSMKYDRERVEKALIDAGFGDRLASLEKGLDTFVYKNLTEDGVDVSGGEAQKIAIARALYKDAPFIILDEPTAALDPIAEAEIYSKFNDIAGDKTAIYISHRLSSCKFCDEIAVFHEGAVIQHGTHAELVADETGKYHELWNAQAQYYTEKTA